MTFIAMYAIKVDIFFNILDLEYFGKYLVLELIYVYVEVL